MKKTIQCIGILCFLLVICQLNFAQNIILGGEGGYTTNEFGNDSKDNIPIYGIFGSATIAGDTSKKWGYGVNITGEYKSDKSSEYTDLLAAGDFAIRIKNFSFGPGGNYGYISRGDVDDPTCLRVPVNEPPGQRSSCGFNDIGPGRSGKRGIGQLNLLGVGGFAKYQYGRTFIQGRYTHYDKSMGYLMQPNAIVALGTIPSPISIPDYTDYPEFDGGRDIRVSAGYIFKGNYFVRAQYIDRKLDFTRELGNLTGVFDQKTRMFTFGGGIIMNF